jgi:hypothetical protein
MFQASSIDGSWRRLRVVLAFRHQMHGKPEAGEVATLSSLSAELMGLEHGTGAWDWSIGRGGYPRRRQLIVMGQPDLADGTAEGMASLSDS